MNSAIADVRVGAARQSRGMGSFANRVGIAHGTLPSPTVIFERKNQRRLQLLEMEFAGVLSQADKAELAHLERDTAGIMNYLHPLPTTMLDELEALASRLESHVKPKQL